MQKPKFIANCLDEILLSCRYDLVLKSVEDILEFSKSRAPTARNLINALVCEPKSGSKKAIFSYLTRFIKSWRMDDLKVF